MKLLCSIAPVSIVLASTIAAAQPRPGAILDDLAATRAFEEIASTPDGQRVAWVEKVIDKGRDTGRAAVFAAALDGKRPPVRLGEGRLRVMTPSSWDRASPGDGPRRSSRRKGFRSYCSIPRRWRH